MFAQNDSYNDMEFVFQFESAKSDLPPNLVDALLTTLQDKPYNIFIQGHTDSDGSLTYNQQLSEQRVQHIQKQLATAGIPDDKIMTQAFGETQPIASNQTESGKRLNRRVNITLSTKNTLNSQAPIDIQERLIALLGDGKQFFDLSYNQEAITIIGEQGTQVEIPANAFENPNKLPVTVALTEVYKPSDMIVHNLTTTSHQHQLVTGGMIKIEAFVDGKPVNLKADKIIKLHAPTDNPQSEMQLFDAEQIGYNTNWINPRPIQISSMPTNNSRNFLRPINRGGSGTNNNFYWNVIPDYLPIKGKGNRPEEVTKPVYKDSLQIIETLEEIEDRKANPWKYFKKYKTKKFLFWSFKVKANSPKDSTKHLKRMENINKSLERKIERYSKDLSNYNKELKEYQAYEQEMFRYNNWEQYSDSIAAINLKTAIQYKSREGINQFSNHLPSEQQYQIWMDLYEINDIDFMRGVFSQPQSYQDSLYCSVASANKDTLGINLIKTEHYKQQLMMNIYNVKTPLTAFLLHKKRVDAENEKRTYKQLMRNFGVGTRAEVDSIQKVRRIEAQKRQQELNRQYSYVAELRSIGRFINFDFFPKFNVELIVSNGQLKRPLAQTKTFMLFEDYNTIMPAYANDPLAFNYVPALPNRYEFINIPNKARVKVISFYWDDDKQAHLAINSMAASTKLPSLSYKSVSDEELKLAIRGLD